MTGWACNCFDQNTLIKREVGLVKIKDIDASSHKVWNPIQNNWMQIEEKTSTIDKGVMVTLQTENGQVKVTNNHPFVLNNGQVVQAIELKANDIIYGGDKVIGTELSVEDKNIVVYNLRVMDSSENTLDHVIEAGGVICGDLTLQTKVEYIVPTPSAELA